MMRFRHYESIILANASAFFEYLAENGRSKNLRHLGRSYKDLNVTTNILEPNNNNVSILGRLETS